MIQTLEAKEHVEKYRQMGWKVTYGLGDIHANINARSFGINPYRYFQVKHPLGVFSLSAHPLFSEEKAHGYVLQEVVT